MIGSVVLKVTKSCSFVYCSPTREKRLEDFLCRPEGSYPLPAEGEKALVVLLA